MRRDQEFFNNVVKTLVGSKTIFVEKRGDTTIPLDTDFLYLQHHRDLEPVRLLPVSRMRESPRTPQNACYFFSRVNSDGVRWVSYHFEMDADITTPGERFRNEVLSLLDTVDVES